MGRVVWNDKALLKDIDRVVNNGLKKVADHIGNRMRQNATRDSEMVAAITTKKSQFQNGGFVIGVFDSTSDSGKWEDSLAARAVYQDYGHAKPYQGRGHKKRSKVTKAVAGNHFMRKALRSGKSMASRVLSGALK